MVWCRATNIRGTTPPIAPAGCGVSPLRSIGATDAGNPISVVSRVHNFAGNLSRSGNVRTHQNHQTGQWRSTRLVARGILEHATVRSLLRRIAGAGQEIAAAGIGRAGHRCRPRLTLYRWRRPAEVGTPNLSAPDVGAATTPGRRKPRDRDTQSLRSAFCPK